MALTAARTALGSAEGRRDRVVRPDLSRPIPRRDLALEGVDPLMEASADVGDAAFERAQVGGDDTQLDVVEAA